MVHPDFIAIFPKSMTRSAAWLGVLFGDSNTSNHTSTRNWTYRKLIAPAWTVQGSTRYTWKTIYLSCLVTKPAYWHVRPAKTQISLGIRPVWLKSSLWAQWVAKDPSFLHADSEDSDQTGRTPRLIWVFAGRTCHFVGFVTRRLNLHLRFKDKLLKEIRADKYVTFGLVSHIYLEAAVGNLKCICPSYLRYFWKTGSPSHNVSVAKNFFKNVNLQILDFISVKLTNTPPPQYGVVCFHCNKHYKKQRKHTQN